MSTPEHPPQQETKPQISTTSTPVLAGNDEWFEDAVLRALITHNAKQKQLAKEKHIPFS